MTCDALSAALFFDVRWCEEWVRPTNQSKFKKQNLSLKKKMKIYCVRRKGNIILQYSAITPCCHIRTTEGAKYAMIAHRSNKTITEALNGPNFCFKCLPYALLFKRQRCNEAYLFYVIKPPTDFVWVVFVFRTCTLIYAQSIRFSNVCVYYILSAYRLRSAFYVSFKGLYLNSSHFDQDINDYQQ